MPSSGDGCGAIGTLDIDIKDSLKFGQCGHFEQKKILKDSGGSMNTLAARLGVSREKLEAS